MYFQILRYLPSILSTFTLLCAQTVHYATKLLSVLFTLLFIVVKRWQSYCGNYFNRLHRSVVRTILNLYYIFKNYYLVYVIQFLCQWNLYFGSIYSFICCCVNHFNILQKLYRLASLPSGLPRLVLKVAGQPGLVQVGVNHVN